MINLKLSTFLVSTTLATLAVQPVLAAEPKRSKAATAPTDSSSKTHSAEEELVITAQLAPQAVARAVQQEAPNLVVVQSYAEIKKLPDISAAEAVRRLPGMSLETDEGEGRYVNCRGLDADLNSTTFGGLRLPPTNNASPFGGYRAVALDSMPIGLVGAITVTKSNLPEQDAEALGCTIEITPKTAPPGGQPFIQGDAAGGYEPLRKTSVENFQVTAGGHFGGAQNFLGNGPFSIVLTAAYNEDRRGIDDVEPGYFNNPALPYFAMNDLQQRDYELHRRRHALGIDLGFQPDAENSWYLRAFEAGYTERYKRQFMEIIPDGNAALIPSGQIQDTLGGATAINKSLRDESETSKDRVFVAGGKNQFGNGSVLDYRIGYTQGTYHKPYDVNSQFSYAGAPGTITYAPTGPGHVPVYAITGADYLNWSNYSLSGLSNGTADNFDRELSGAANYQLPIRLVGSDESLKFGVDARQRHKRTVSQPLSYSNLTAVPLTQAIKGADETYYGGVYENGPDIVPGYLQGIFGFGSPSPSDVISADQQYLDVHEDVYAGYGEYRGTWGNLSLIAGARVERTNDKSDAFSVTKDPNTGNQIVNPIVTRHHYTNVFPGAQLRYAFQPSLIGRLTYSSTIARPGFNQSNPSESVDLGSGIITHGNPNLKPAFANSFDVSLEKYLGHAGIVSIGYFYKDIKDYIVGSSSGIKLVNYNGQNFFLQDITFSNARNAHAQGIEVNLDARLRMLPGLLSGLGVGLNYTYVDSSFEIRPGEHSLLPSTSRHTWNATLFYEKGPLTLKLAAYSVSADLFAIGGDKTSDVYNARRTSMDFGGSYAIDRHWQIYFDAKNLLNTPHAFWEGTPDRPIQREFYRQTYLAGVRFDY